MSRPSSYRAHLGETAAALVDGELGHGARESALAHLAHCPACRSAVDEQRRTKAMLAGTVAPQVPEELAARLRAIGSTSPLASRPPFSPAGSRPPTLAGSRRPGGRRPGSGRRRSRAWAAATGVATTLVLGLGTAFLAGGAPNEGPRVTPAVDRYAVEHAATTGGVGFPESAVEVAVTVSFEGTSAP